MADWNETLAGWLKVSGKNKKQLAEASGINYNTLKQKMREGSGLTEEQRGRLYSATGLEVFGGLSPQENPDAGNVQISRQSLRELISLTSQSRELSDNLSVLILGERTDCNDPKALKVAVAFYNLVESLFPYREATPEKRKALSALIPGEDIGYVYSFLKAIYSDENAFDMWKDFSYKGLRGARSKSQGVKK